MPNQVGYVAALPKAAAVTGHARKFSVCDATSGEIVFGGNLTDSVRDAASSDKVQLADFSELRRTGRFYIRIGQTRSCEFEISDAPYENLLSDIRKTFYYSRCGSALHRIRAGKFRRKTCHIEPAILLSDKNILLDVSGGWHDAGDYSRCTVTAALSLAHLLYAFELFPTIFRDADGISDMGRKCPAIIEECQYELEWLLKMQDKDGGVYHKVSSMDYADYVLPGEDDKRLYVFGKSAAATTAFAAVMALAARVFEPMGLRIMKKLRPAALAAWIWLINNPEEKPFVNPPRVKSPEYNDDDLSDDKFWAACELFSLTGEDSFSDKIEKIYDSINTSGFSLHNMGGFGAISYIFSSRDKNPDILEKLKASLLYRAENICSVASHSGYRTALVREDYVWGSNLTLLSNTITLIAANTVEPRKEFTTCVLDQIDYLLGRNALSRSFVTGYGENCIKHPHYRPTMADDIDEVIPGLVVSGPDMSRSDEHSKWLIPFGTPPAKCHLDIEHSYSTNETSIFFNSASVFVFAYISGLCEGCAENDEKGD